MLRCMASVFVTVGVFLALVVSATASEQRDDWLVSPHARVSGVLEQGFNRGDGEVGYTQVDVGVETTFVSLGYSRYSFDWENAQSLPFSNGATDPWSDLNQFSVSTELPIELNERFTWRTGLGLNAAWEDEVSDSISLDVSLGLMWQISNEWDAVFGAAYTWHPDVDLDSNFSPLGGISWNRDTNEGWSAALGFPSTEVRYAFDESRSMALGLTGNGGVFRLADDSRVAPGGYAEIEQIGLGLQYNHALAERWSIGASANYFFDGDWRFYNVAGNEFLSIEKEGRPGFGLNLSGRF